MKKIFVGTSFSGIVDYETGMVLPESGAGIEAVLRALRNVGDVVVFCAIEHEGWLISNSPPEIGVQNDLSEIDQSDVFLALLSGTPSEGLQYEMGHAAGEGKTVIVATPADINLGYFNQGLANLGRIQHVLYSSPEVLAHHVGRIIGS